jgi:hypothetical protein
MAANVGSAGLAQAAEEDGVREFELSEENAAALVGGRRRRSRKYRGGDNSGALLQLAGQSTGSCKAMEPADTAKAYAAAFQVAKAQLPLLQAAKHGGGNTSDPSKMVHEAMKNLPLLEAAQQKGGNASNNKMILDAMNKVPALQIVKQNGGNTGAIVNLASTRSVITPGANQPLPGVSGKPMEDLGPVSGGAITLRSRKGKISLKAPKNSRIQPALTRKVRKIKVGVKGIKTRLNRAKKAHNHAQSMPIATVKQRLVKAGVIKSTTKAPEHMLRTMYADLLVTKKGL